MVLEHDAAFETRGDLTSIVLHPPERSDPAVVDGGGAAEEPRLRAAADQTVDDARAGDGRLP